MQQLCYYFVCRNTGGEKSKKIFKSIYNYSKWIQKTSFGVKTIIKLKSDLASWWNSSKFTSQILCRMMQSYKWGKSHQETFQLYINNFQYVDVMQSTNERSCRLFQSVHSCKRTVFLEDSILTTSSLIWSEWKSKLNCYQCRTSYLQR